MAHLERHKKSILQLLLSSDDQSINRKKHLSYLHFSRLKSSFYYLSSLFVFIRMPQCELLVG